MYCTGLHLEKRTWYGCLAVMLLLGLLLQAFSPFLGQEVWDETLLCGLRSRRWVRRRCHGRYGIMGLGFLTRRGGVLLCRMGLVAALLMWSGWPQRWPVAWALLSLPLADAFLCLLALLWPRVLKVQAYGYLVRGVHDVYRLMVVVLFSGGLLSD